MLPSFSEVKAHKITFHWCQSRTYFLPLSKSHFKKKSEHQKPKPSSNKHVYVEKVTRVYPSEEEHTDFCSIAFCDSKTSFFVALSEELLEERKSIKCPPMDTQVRQKANHVAVDLSIAHCEVSKSSKILRVERAFWAISEFGVRTARSAFKSNRSQISENLSKGTAEQSPLMVEIRVIKVLASRE